VGYCGGKKRNPTYTSMGDHTETIQIDFNTSILSYEDILKAFWEAHSPTSKGWSVQYQAALFYHSSDEKKMFEKSKTDFETRLGRKVHTGILPFTTFTLAEDYHQKYYLRGRISVLTQLNLTDEEIINSSLACYLNALISGHCSSNRRNEIFELVKSEGNPTLTSAVERFVGIPSAVAQCGV